MFVVSVLCCQVDVSATKLSLREKSYRMWRVVVCDQETSCDVVAMKKRAEPVGNTFRKNPT
jgi:hypothetical protein